MAAPVKALLVLVAVVALVVGGFLAFLRFGAGNAVDAASHLTTTVTGQVTDAVFERDNRASTSRGYRVQLRYEVEGEAFLTDAWVPEETPDSPPRTVTVCVDPDDPAVHAVPTRPGAACGDGSLGRNDEQRAEPAGRAD